jgi:hypothetical protein
MTVSEVVRSRRIIVLVVGLAVLSVSAPGPAMASPSEDNCGAYVSFAYSLPLPDAMRTPGAHRVQWHEDYLDENGIAQVLDTENEINIVPGTPLFSGTVLVRLFTNWGAHSTKDIDFDVHQIDPDQPASLFATVWNLRGTPNFSTDRMSARWESAPEVWSSWYAMPQSSPTSFCVEQLTPLLHRTFGWVG